jgi:hypothetical protein
MYLRSLNNLEETTDGTMGTFLSCLSNLRLLEFMRGRSGQGCNTAIQGRASINFFILSAESTAVLNLICNCFAARLN